MNDIRHDLEWELRTDGHHRLADPLVGASANRRRPEENTALPVGGDYPLFSVRVARASGESSALPPRLEHFPFVKNRIS